MLRWMRRLTVKRDQDTTDRPRIGFRRTRTQSAAADGTRTRTRRLFELRRCRSSIEVVRDNVWTNGPVARFEAGFIACRHGLGGPCYGGLASEPVPSTNGVDLGSKKKGPLFWNSGQSPKAKRPTRPEVSSVFSLINTVDDQYRRSALVDHKTNCIVAPCLVRRCTWIPNIDHRSCTLGDRSAEDPRYALCEASLIPRSAYTIFRFGTKSSDTKKALRLLRVLICRGCCGPRHEDGQLVPITYAIGYASTICRCTGQLVGKLERHLELLGRRAGYLSVIGCFPISDITRADPSSAEGEV